MTDPTHPGQADAPSADPRAGDHPAHRPAAPPHQPQRSLMLKVVRAAFFVLFITVTILSVINVDNIQTGEGSPLTENYALSILAAVVIGAVIVAIDVFTPRKKVAMLFAVFFALMGGLMVTGALGLIVDLLARLYEFHQAESVVATLKVLVGICVCYLAIAIVLQTQDDFRLVIPYVEFAKQIRGVRPLLLDTSVLIDARILDVARTGVLQAPLIVPRFVVNELQTLADSADKSKRAKGRRGLALVARLQQTPGLDVSVDETPIPGKAVDQMLVELARSMPASIVTTDLGLARVATIQDVSVLNLHDLAAALRAPVATGDRITLRILKTGEQPGQGVGYLDDGTMVVVQDAADRIDQDLDVVIGTSLQTAAGRLVFAKPADAAGKTPAPAGLGSAEPEEAGSPNSGDDLADLPDPPPAAGSLPPAPPATSIRPPRNPLGPGGRPRSSSRNPRR